MRFDPQSAQVPIDGPLSAEAPARGETAGPPRSGLAGGLAILVGAGAIGVGAWIWLDSSSSLRGAAAGEIQAAISKLDLVMRADETPSVQTPFVSEAAEKTVTDLLSLNRSSRSSRAYEQGRTFMAAGLPRKAIPQFTEAIALDPNHAGARYSLGLAYVRSGNHKKAREQRVVLEGLDQNLANMLANLTR